MHERGTSTILQSAKAGDQPAINALLQQHRPAIISQAARILRNNDDAENAAQEVCLRIYRALPQFTESALFSTWVFRITQNVCFSMLSARRREQNRTWFEDTSPESQIYDADTQPKHAFAQLVQGLAEDEKQLLALRFAQDREIADIAHITQRSLSATKMRLYRALAKLRCALEAEAA